MFLGLNLCNVGLVGSLIQSIIPSGGVSTGIVTFSFVDPLTVQTWVVPQGTTNILAKIWGGGGQGALNGWEGGSGAFVQGSFTVIGGQQIGVSIGYGGGPAFILSGTTGYAGCTGGGYSAVEYPYGSKTAWLVAGGGGGAGSGNLFMFYGGNGGISGGNGDGDLLGLPTAGRYTLGSGALTGAGGNGGTSAQNAGTNGISGQSGLLLQGGSGGYHYNGTFFAVGGGGGGGYYGGGGAGATVGLQSRPAGGGGGSSIISGCTSGTNNGINFTDPLWNGTAGISGNQGYVVLIYS